MSTTIIPELFYLFAFIALYQEGIIALNPKRSFDGFRFINCLLDTKDKKIMERFIADNLWTVIYQYAYVIWGYVGLVTANWPFFLGLCLLSLVLKKPRENHWHWLLADAIASIVLLLCIIVFHYSMYFK